MKHRRRIIIMVLMVLLFVSSASAYTPRFYINVPIKNGAIVNGTYQYNFTINTSMLNGQQKPDFSDIRIRKNIISSYYPYWTRATVNNSYITGFFNTTEVLSSVIVDWGDSAASSASDGNSTFPFFDDFDGTVLNPTRWTTIGGPTISLSGGALTISSLGWNNDFYIKTSSFTANRNISILTSSREIDAGQYPSDVGFGTLDAGGYGAQKGIGSNGAFNVRARAGGAASSSINVGVSTLFSSFDIDWLPGQVAVYENSLLRGSVTSNIPNTPLPVAIGAAENGGGTWGFGTVIQYIAVAQYLSPTPTFDAVNASTVHSYLNISFYSNDLTNDQQTDFIGLLNRQTNFTLINTGADRYEWSVNGTNQSNNANYFLYNFPVGGTTQINATVVNTTYDRTQTLLWNVTPVTYSLELRSPANASTNTATTVTLRWRQWELNTPYTFQVAEDSAFVGVISQGTGQTTAGNENISAELPGLSTGTKYYWRVAGSDGIYTSAFEFTTTGTAVSTGAFNITVFDEQNWGNRIANFAAQIYNTTYTLNKTTSTGWINFTSSEIGSGQYLVHIVPNSSYAARYVLETSPGNVTAYLPSTTNTIDTVDFYLYDYTGLFPTSTSVLTVYKNNTVMASSYFDEESKVAVNLIQGDSYTIQVSNGGHIYQAGNFYPIASGPSNLVILNLGYNTSQYLPFNYNITWNHNGANNITISWTDLGTLSDLNITIYKGDNRAQLVYTLDTSSRLGQVTYLITNTSDVYYLDFTANTTNGNVVKNLVFDYRLGTTMGAGTKSLRTYRTFTMPEWALSTTIFIILLLLGGSLGAVHSGFGSVVMGIWFFIFWAMGLFPSLVGVTISIIGAIVFLFVLLYLKEKEHT